MRKTERGQKEEEETDGYSLYFFANLNDLLL